MQYRHAISKEEMKVLVPQMYKVRELVIVIQSKAIGITGHLPAAIRHELEYNGSFTGIQRRIQTPKGHSLAVRAILEVRYPGVKIPYISPATIACKRINCASAKADNFGGFVELLFIGPVISVKVNRSHQRGRRQYPQIQNETSDYPPPARNEASCLV